MGEVVEFLPYNNGFSQVHYETKCMNNNIIEKQSHENDDDDSWFEEEIDVDLKWSFALNRYIFTYICVFLHEKCMSQIIYYSLNFQLF